MLMIPFEKPRLYVRRGIWVCKNNHAMGHGYTPPAAYLDWLEQARSSALPVAA